MNDANALTTVAEELAELVTPLRSVIEDPAPPHELLQLLGRAGWALPGVQAPDLGALTAAWSGLLDAVDALPSALQTDGLLDVFASLEAVGTAMGELRQAHVALGALLGTSDAAVLEALAGDLVQSLIVRWLGRRRPVTLQVLRALELVRRVEVEQIGGSGGDPVLRAAGRTLALEPAGLLELLRDPAGALRASYLPDTWAGSRDAQAFALFLASRLRALVRVLGGELATWPPDGHLGELPAAQRDAASRTMTLAVPLPAPGGSPLQPTVAASVQFLSAADHGALGRPGPGFELSPAAPASWSAVRGGWTIDLAVGATADTVLVTSEETVAQGGTSLAAELAVRGSQNGSPAILGADGGTRIELGVPTLTLGVELADVPDAGVELVLNGMALVVSAGDGDSFLAGVLPDVDLTAGLDLGLAWSRRGGLRLSGANAGLEFRVPIERDIAGVATLHWVDASLLLGDELELGLGTALTITLGPFSARVEGLGLNILLRFPPDGDGNLGLADVTLAFRPPTGVAFELDLGEAGHGSGFVGYDPALGRYFGALELELVSVGLGAMVVIDTRLPDDPSGWALFASVFATFPSLPLGFGFFLSGVGGLACLNRTLDGDALASGLKSGAIDAILFPDNVLEDLPLILSQLDAWFPLAEGSSVFGVAAKITWGTPVTIVTGQLGIALVLPDLEIAVMGSVAMLLPTEDEALLELHMDSLGVIDVPGGTVMVVASLYDSALLSTIHLSGDMAFYVSVGASPYFLLSVGGYHPNFDPPCGLPASVLALDRMRAEVALSDDVFFALETYVAVTANTLQFGSLATLVASAKFLLTTYTARGSVGFDVLLVFSPFSFSAAFQLSVSVSAGDKELLAVDLVARLDGPAPWFTSGYARFEFFGVGVRFDFEFGGPVQPEIPAREDVCDLVVAALGVPAAWRAAQPAWADTTLLVFAPDEVGDAAEPWVRPDAELEARQTVAPLDRGLDHFGVYAIDGPTTLSVTSAGIDGIAEGEDFVTITDWFAPAQYDELSRAEKLAAPSYEEMATGVRFGAGGLGFDAAEATTVVPDYEERVIEEDETRTVDVQSVSHPLETLALDTALQRRPRTVTSATLAVAAPTWQTFDPATGTATGPARSYRAAQLALAAARTADPGSGLRLAPAHAAEAVA